MSHFAVYALTRNVGIDIVPPVPPSRGCSPGIPGASSLLLSRISDFAKFLRAGRVITPPCPASRLGMPSAYILATAYAVQHGGAHAERKITRLLFISD